jgi:hypothetical protein
MTKELLIYCDESAKDGKHFSNFYGGILVRSDHVDAVRQSIAAKKIELNLHGEVKWNKITEPYKGKYISPLEHVFDLVAADKLKVRIMFTQNMRVPIGLTAEQKENEYFLLYYQFLKNAFGLRYCSDGAQVTRIRLFLDQLPDTKEKAQRFKNYICALSENPRFKAARVEFRQDSIADAVSHEHDILQCLDIILGSMQFRLNDMHLEKPTGAKRRGKRTRAKEEVYKYINKRIREIYPGFNIGASTSKQHDLVNTWAHPYRHWLFIAREHEVKPGMSKHKKT